MPLVGGIESKRMVLRGLKEHLGNLQTPNMREYIGWDYSPHHPLCRETFSDHRRV